MLETAATHEAAAGVSYALRWIVALPLAGAAINLIAGKRLQDAAGRTAVAVLGSAMSIASFVCVVAAFLRLRSLPVDERLLLDTVSSWIHIGDLDVSIALAFDPLSAVMCLIITGIGSLIHIYSYGYMDEDPANWRFFGMLNLFLFCMLTLILGDNMLVMFVGWEGVGLCSWGLIGFWHSDHTNTAAANKAFLVNRIGDFAFLCGMFLLFWSLADSGKATLVFRELAHAVPALEGMTLWGMGVATLVTLLLFVGATGKSAQIPLYVWLPDAMAGPTPVSALIHAATMVTAGVYMIVRLNFLFSMAPFTMQVITAVGAATAFFAATIGLSQHDIKKVLAYSTVSQLGYMFMAVGVGAYAAGIFHLLTHAFFKACLFLGAGSVIHALHHEQDMRRMGGLRSYMPVTFGTFLISALAIAGVPGFAGFFSKDEILWRAFLANPVIWAVGLAAAGMTAFYMFRAVFLTFAGECRVEGHAREHLHESSWTMTLPLVVLAAGAAGAGYLGVPAALGGANHFEQWLAPVVELEHAALSHAAGGHDTTLEYVLMALSVATAGLGILLAYLIYIRKSLSAATFAAIGGGVPYRLSFNKYFVDEFYYGFFLNGVLSLSRALAWIDLHVVDGIVNGAARVVRISSDFGGAIDHYVVDGLVNGTATVVDRCGAAARKLQTGGINAYLYVLVLAVILVLFSRAW